MLVGIVVNNAIVLIDYANILRRDEGMEIRDALVMAGKSRLRPILMSTLTTVVGLVPMAFGSGVEDDGEYGGSSHRRPVVLHLTNLILIPTLYLIFRQRGPQVPKTAETAEEVGSRCEIKSIPSQKPPPENPPGVAFAV